MELAVGKGASTKRKNANILEERVLYMAKKKYTDEELRERKRESKRKWKENNPNYDKDYYLKNKTKILAKTKEYKEKNKEQIKEKQKKYVNENQKEINERRKIYRKTPNGRAVMLVNGYQQKDKKYKRGDCTITGKWIVENIFTKSCHYCGEDDWRKLGCDRVDSKLPHVPENVVPCCTKCNEKKGEMGYNEFVKKCKK